MFIRFVEELALDFEMHMDFNYWFKSVVLFFENEFYTRFVVTIVLSIIVIFVVVAKLINH